MGYEVKMYVGEHSNIGDGYISVIGMVDLCKPDYRDAVSKIDSETSAIKGYIYCDDGNTKLELDRYDRPVRIHLATAMLEALQAANKREKYRRYSIAIAFLKEALKHFPAETLVVVLYGY